MITFSSLAQWTQWTIKLSVGRHRRHLALQLQFGVWSDLSSCIENSTETVNSMPYQCHIPLYVSHWIHWALLTGLGSTPRVQLSSLYFFQQLQRQTPLRSLGAGADGCAEAHHILSRGVPVVPRGAVGGPNPMNKCDSPWRNHMKSYVKSSSVWNHINLWNHMSANIILTFQRIPVGFHLAEALDAAATCGDAPNKPRPSAIAHFSHKHWYQLKGWWDRSHLLEAPEHSKSFASLMNGSAQLSIACYLEPTYLPKGVRLDSTWFNQVNQVVSPKLQYEPLAFGQGQLQSVGMANRLCSKSAKNFWTSKIQRIQAGQGLKGVHYDININGYQ